MYQVRFPLSVVSFPNALRLNTLADPGRAGAPARLFILPPTVTLSGLRMERMGEASFLASLSAGDLAAGERLLQVGHPVIRHLGAAEVQRGELLEILQLLQARIRHPGAAEVQRGELLEVLQLLQTPIRHLGRCISV